MLVISEFGEIIGRFLQAIKIKLIARVLETSEVKEETKIYLF